MLAAVLKDFNNLVLEDVAVPEPGIGEVVVRVHSCGICATDYKAVKGIRKNVSFPFIPGHEASGVVSAVGPGVTHVSEGDEVLCSPMGYCGVCQHCRVGNTHYCERCVATGGDGGTVQWAGAFAEYMKTQAVSVYRKPANISFDAAALTEPLGGSWKGVIEYSRTSVGEDVVIIGVGGIGALCMMVAKAAGAGRLIAVDPSGYARNKALEWGATHVVDPGAGDAKRQVYDILPGGPDVIIEAAGPINAVRLMVDLRRRGTRWNIFGITTHETFELDGGLTHFLEGQMNASFGITPRAMVQAIRLMEAGLVNPEKIISHSFPLKKIHEAMDTMEKPNRNKVMVHP